MDTAARFTILNVEDDDAARYVRTRVLNAHGFAVEEAGAGEEALRVALGGRVDLVLLDIHLPDLSGVEVCRRLKKAAPLLPVVHISASAGDVAAGSGARQRRGRLPYRTRGA